MEIIEHAICQGSPCNFYNATVCDHSAQMWSVTFRPQIFVYWFKKTLTSGTLQTVSVHLLIQYCSLLDCISKYSCFTVKQKEVWKSLGIKHPGAENLSSVSSNILYWFFKVFLFTYPVLHITPEYPYNWLSFYVSSYTLRLESDLLACPK